MRNRLKIVINADDFGASDSINRAIVGAFKVGWITSTTIMANGDAFEDACQLSREEGLVDRIGVHLNLNDGIPLTDEIKRCSRFCDEEGRMVSRSRKWGGFYPLTFVEKKAVITEVKAQIRRCRDHGLPLTHADSHTHIHTQWCLGLLIMDVLKEEGIKYLRISRNVGKDLCLLKKLYKGLYNKMIEWKGLKRATYFARLDDVSEIFKKKGIPSNASIEMMCHPTWGPSGQLINMNSSNMEELVKSLAELAPRADRIPYVMNIL